jgi:hypothetical protein
VKLDLPLDAEDVRVLRGALLAARATELAEIKRRDFRMSTGYGTDSAREGMNAEMAQRHRRIELLDRLIRALDGSTDPHATTQP